MTLLFTLALIFTLPAHTGYVTDRAHMLSDADRQALNDQLLAYEQRTTNEVAVLIVPTLDGLTIDEYANRVFHAWGIGKKDKDNGVLFVWSTKERKIRIEVGYGLEPILPDGRTGQIIRENIAPAFVESRWRDGVYGGVNAILAQLNLQTTAAVPTPRQASDEGSWLWPLILIGVFGASVYVAWLMYSERKRRQTYNWRSEQAKSDQFAEIYGASPDTVEKVRRYSSYTPLPYTPPSYDSSPSFGSSDAGSSSGSSDSGGSFGGGDSGGGGASGDY